VPRIYNLAVVGFGNVGRCLVGLLDRKRRELESTYGIAFRVTGIASRRLGWKFKSSGFDLQQLLTQGADGESSLNVTGWLRASHADVLFEASSLNFETGQPAIDHIRAALNHRAHAISANKGPVVHGYRELIELAAQRKRKFLFESSVMDGIPIFSMFRESLPAIELRGFSGILNSTTNVILGEMEAGQTLEDAIVKAQQLGVAETDPSADIDGWDAAVKVSALVTVLMGVPLPPEKVARQGIRDLTSEKTRRAREEGAPYKLLCRANRQVAKIEASVGPERVPLTSPFAHVSGTSSIISFETDIFPALTITEENPGLEATAYGMLSDFINAVKSESQP
jgi:homoserine dehydrogenase